MRELVGAAAFKAWLNSGEAEPVAILGVDLDPFAGAIAKGRLNKSVLLGCRMSAQLHEQLTRDGARIIAELGLLPDPLRSFPTELYSVAALYAGFDPANDGSWKGTPDNLGWNAQRADYRPDCCNAATTRHLH